MNTLLAISRFALAGPANDQQYLTATRLLRKGEGWLEREPDTTRLMLGALAVGMLRAGLRRYEERQGDSLRQGSWNATYSGRRFWVLDPRADEVEVEDIAHGLARTSRFYGATSGRPYSVAQHSVVGSFHVAPEYALHFLLHDAAETYVGDVASPIKSVMGGAYAGIESGVSAAIAARFGLDWTPEAEFCVKQTDNDMVVTEGDQLLPYRTLGLFPSSAHLLPVKLVPWGWRTAKMLFKARLNTLLRRRIALARQEE